MKNRELTSLQVGTVTSLSWGIQAGVTEQALATAEERAESLENANRKLKHELANAKAIIFSGGVVLLGLPVLFALLLAKGGCP